MNSFKVEGGVRLSGEVFPQGAKNEALQVICSVILTEKEVIIDNGAAKGLTQPILVHSKNSKNKTGKSSAA